MSDYRKKMKTFLLDKTYKDPTNTIALKTKTLIEKSKIKLTLKPTNPLPKIPKTI